MEAAEAGAQAPAETADAAGDLPALAELGVRARAAANAAGADAGKPGAVGCREDAPEGPTAEQYPMLCHCCEDGPVKPRGLCRLSRGGHRGRLSLTSRLTWAVPIFGWYCLKYLKVGYMRKFYTDDYPGASLGIIAFSSVLSVLVDAFTDPAMATWTDNLRSKFGRRRPFVAAAALFVPIVFILAWVPAIVPSGLAASLWYGFFHIMYKLADTLWAIPHDAWGAQLTPIYEEKTMVWRSKKIAANTGVVFGMAVVPFFFVSEQCSSTPDDTCVELPIISAAFGAFFFVSAGFLALRGREPPLERSARAARRADFTEEDTIPMLISTSLNRPFRILLISDIVKSLGEDIPFVVLPFMTAWVLGEQCMSATKVFQYAVIMNIVAGLLAVPLWSCLAMKTNKYCAHLSFSVGMTVILLVMASFGYDDGDCAMTYWVFAVVALFGAMYGGVFLIEDILSDLVDYDQLLTGGLRREASYLMAIDFIPKFMNIPGESVPFLAMAYLKYARPAIIRPACGAELQASSDLFCSDFYASEVVGQELCSAAATCQQLVDAGVTFVCNHALGKCGHKQNESVQLVLLLSFSLVPAIFTSFGVIALIFYPKLARSRASHKALLEAIAKLKEGETVEDPWRPGSFVHPREAPTANAGALSYFYPQELRAVLDASSAEAADVSRLWRGPLAWTLFGAAMLPAGVAMVASGWEGLRDDLGASESPLGLMLVGVGVVLAWFHGVRVWAALHLRRRGVLRDEVRAKFNALAPFTGAARAPPLPDTARGAS